MKYIDADRMKVLLSDLKENHKYYNGDFHDGVVFTVDEIEEVIDSIQQEFEVYEFSFQGGTATINGVEHSFKPGKAKVIILDITENES